MGKPIIFLVDDDKQLLDSLTTQLRAAAFGKQISIETAQTLDEAWDALTIMVHEGDRIGLIVSDWLFPHEQRSNDFLVRVHKKYPGIPLVLLSGYADEASVQQAFEQAGLRAYFRKPWEEEELMSGVEKILISENILQ
ncbi:MAG: response regulator [Bacteroidetes bacterium]|nr:response regulator [Bacteroidota bacterium]